MYLFSGLGADERVFQKMDFSAYSVAYIQWVLPEKNESLEDYSKRLIVQIQHEKPILIGVSFGGIIAIEVGKYIQTEKIILLASVKTKFELPFMYRFSGKLKIHKLIPVALLKSGNRLSYWFFGAKNPYEKKLLKQILYDTNSVFLKWAIDKVTTWENTNIPENLLHIHGTKDRILPFRKIKSAQKIEDGGHFMTLNKFTEIDELIAKKIFLK